MLSRMQSETEARQLVKDARAANFNAIFEQTGQMPLWMAPP